MIATVLAAMGRPDEALAELEPWLKPQVPEVSRHLALSARAALAGLAGRRSEALRTAAAASAIRDDWLARTFLAGLHEVGGDPTVARAGLMAWREPDPGRAWRFAWRGLWERADELAPAGAGQTDPPSLRRLRPSSDLLLEALRARRAGRTEEAIRLAEEAVAATPNTTASVVPGVLLAEAGRCGEALPHLDRVAAIFPWPWNQRDAPARIPFALLEGARCAVRLGRPAEARARLDRLLALWVHADADLPELLEARALSARLPR